MWKTTKEMDEPPTITVKYDNMPLPSDQVAGQIPDWVHNINIGH